MTGIGRNLPRSHT